MKPVPFIYPKFKCNQASRILPTTLRLWLFEFKFIKINGWGETGLLCHTGHVAEAREPHAGAATSVDGVRAGAQQGCTGLPVTRGLRFRACSSRNPQDSRARSSPPGLGGTGVPSELKVGRAGHRGTTILRPRGSLTWDRHFNVKAMTLLVSLGVSGPPPSTPLQSPSDVQVGLGARGRCLWEDWQDCGGQRPRDEGQLLHPGPQHPPLHGGLRPRTLGPSEGSAWGPALPGRGTAGLEPGRRMG